MVRAAVLANYLEVAQRLGLNPQQQLNKVGLSGTIFSNPEQRIPIDAAVALLEESARDSGCMNFGLLMAELRQLSHFGAVSLLVSHQQTMRDVLHSLMQYRHLMNESLAMHIEDIGKNVIIREEIVTDSGGPSRQAIEFALGVLHRTGNALIGPQWNPQNVRFTHEAPSDLRVHWRVFNCAIEFGSEFNGFVCAASDLDYPNPAADPVMAGYAQRLVDSFPNALGDSIVLEVRKAIYLALPTGRATIDQIAQGMGLNVRTMQRQLKDAGTVFSELLNDVQRDLVIRYMENQHYSLSEIAELLGFGIPSSFTRWFAKQYGMAPGLWRKRESEKHNQAAKIDASS
jgi:AraC-like DNA-binding protein